MLDMLLLPCRSLLKFAGILSFSTCDDPAGQSVKHHLLSSYFHAVLSVALAQFGTNGFVSGMHGIIRLAESSPYIQVCELSPDLLLLTANVCCALPLSVILLLFAWYGSYLCTCLQQYISQERHEELSQIQ